jgi:tetratricopeptide (TPR) repeat protein
MRYLFLLFAASLCILSCGDKKDNGANDFSATDKLVSRLSERADKNPDSFAYRVDLLDALDSLGRYKEALAQMNILLAKDSTSNSLWARSGQLLERSGDTVAAIGAYFRSLNIYPDPSNQLYLANLLAERKDDRALLLVNNVSKVQFDDETLASCDFIAGVYHARKGNRKMAEQLFDRCIAHNVQYMVAYLEKGFLYFDAGNYNEALNIFRLASGVNGKYADAFYWQGKTYEALGKTQEAIAMYKEALSLDAGLKEASEGLARLGAVKS